MRYLRLKATIYGKTEASSHCCAAWRTDGRRIVRYFRQFDDARQAALGALKRIHKGNHLATPASPRQMQDWRATCDLLAPRGLSLQDAAAAFAEAKRIAGSARLADAARGYAASAATIQRLLFTEVGNRFIEGRKGKVGVRFFTSDQ